MQQSLTFASQSTIVRLRNWSLHSTQGGLAILLLTLIMIFMLAIGGRFAGPNNLHSMALQLPELGILSLAMMVTLLHGGVNLSIVSTANLCSLATAYILVTKLPGAEGLVWWAWLVASLLASLALSIVIGLVNGCIIAYFGVSPILTTLGTMIFVKGVAIGLTRGTVISGFPSAILYIGSGDVLGVPFGLLLFIACALVVATILNLTPFGASIYLIGSNEKATEFSGIDTRSVIIRIYVLSSVLAAIAGSVMLARFNSANAAYGESYILVTVLASVLGGVDPFGGFGTVSGLILSLLNLQVIASAFNQLHFSQFLTLAIWGLILIAVSALALLRSPWLRR